MFRRHLVGLNLAGAHILYRQVLTFARCYDFTLSREQFKVDVDSVETVGNDCAVALKLYVDFSPRSHFAQRQSAVLCILCLVQIRRIDIDRGQCLDSDCCRVELYFQSALRTLCHDVGCVFLLNVKRHDAH